MSEGLEGSGSETPLGHVGSHCVPHGARAAVLKSRGAHSAGSLPSGNSGLPGSVRPLGAVFSSLETLPPSLAAFREAHTRWQRQGEYIHFPSVHLE